MTDTATQDDTSTNDDAPTGDDHATDDATVDTTDDAAKWKAMARKHEKEAKARAAKIEELERKQLTDDERTIAEARDEGLAAGIAAGATKVAAAELKAALTGIVTDPAAIVEDLDLSKFLTDDHEVDTDKVNAIVTKYEGLSGTKDSDTPKPPAGITPTKQPAGTAGGKTTQERADARFAEWKSRQPKPAA